MDDDNKLVVVTSFSCCEQGDDNKLSAITLFFFAWRENEWQQ
jgi:hypothetical protein